jgi:hypothetical protein
MFPANAKCFVDLRDLIDQGFCYRELSPESVQELIKAARDNFDNPEVCSIIDPLEFQPGQIVTFIYTNPDENTPWRLGVVNEYLQGAWNIWTLNTEWTRDRKTRRKIACGPTYRTYSLGHITKSRVITGVPHETASVAVGDLEEFLKAGRRLIDKLRPQETTDGNP